jgi:hypothetical protein
VKKFGLAFVLVAALGAGTTLTVTAQAAPGGLSGQLGAAADSLNMLEQTQYIYGGRRYCFYVDGWHGPGWYWCGYRHRRGYGWGGAEGWRGWYHGGHRGPAYHGPVHRRPVHRTPRRHR